MVDETGAHWEWKENLASAVTEQPLWYYGAYFLDSDLLDARGSVDDLTYAHE